MSERNRFTAWVARMLGADTPVPLQTRIRGPLDGLAALAEIRRQQASERAAQAVGPTVSQRLTIEAITSIFETGGLPDSDAYAAINIHPDGAGISYGCHQSTAHSGSLEAILVAYYEEGNRLGDLTLDEAKAVAASSRALSSPPTSGPVRELMDLLAEAGRNDLEMQGVQRQVFRRLYWEPAEAYAKNIGLTLPLSFLAVYDLRVHSGMERIDKLRQTFSEYPPSLGGDERLWSAALLRARRDWLAGHSRPVVRRTVYRVDALLTLANEGRWDLARPLVVRGVEIR